MVTKEKEIIKIGFEDVEVWTEWCIRRPRNCLQCHIEGKIACHPRWRVGLIKSPRTMSVEALLKAGKRPMEIHRETGAKLPTIYSMGQKLRNRGEIPRLLEPHPEEQKAEILFYVKEHPNEQYKDIAIIFEVEPSYISRLCSRTGIHRRAMLEEQKSQIVNKALKMLQDEPTRSITSIAEELGMAPSTLGYKLREKGVLPLHHTARLMLETIREEVIKAVKEALSTMREELCCPKCKIK